MKLLFKLLSAPFRLFTSFVDEAVEKDAKEFIADMKDVATKEAVEQLNYSGHINKKTLTNKIKKAIKENLWDEFGRQKIKKEWIDVLVVLAIAYAKSRYLYRV